MVRRLRSGGATIILTTHYIEEAEEMADRIGVIHRGELIVVEDKAVLMRKLGKRQLTMQLQGAQKDLAERTSLHSVQARLRAGGTEATAQEIAEHVARLLQESRTPR